MTDTLKPRDAKDVEEAVRWALDHDKAFELVGTGTKRAIGRPSQTEFTLDLSALSGVTLYEHDELVLSAKAGTPLAEINALIAERGQELAFEPINYGRLLGSAAAGGTIGGALAANLSGPRRIKAGAARDHFLGVSAVSGRGETFKSGGRVVKNVTGYDLCKLIAGSWGTLAAMTDVTIKVLPKAETEATLLVLGLDDAAAMKAMAAAMGSPCDVSGAAHIPADLVVRISDALPVGRSVTALRLEGVAPSVAYHRESLEALLGPVGALAMLKAHDSRTLWRAIRDVVAFAADGPAGSHDVWRISTTPTQGAALGQAIAARAEAQVLYDWAGGLLWLALPPADDAGAAIVRAAVAAAGGHATLIRATVAQRAAVDVFQPQDAGLAALSKRVKDGFDPKGLFNPGRMWAGV